MSLQDRPSALPSIGTPRGPLARSATFTAAASKSTGPSSHTSADGRGTPPRAESPVPRSSSFTRTSRFVSSPDGRAGNDDAHTSQDELDRTAFGQTIKFLSAQAMLERTMAPVSANAKPSADAPPPPSAVSNVAPLGSSSGASTSNQGSDAKTVERDEEITDASEKISPEVAQLMQQCGMSESDAKRELIRRSRIMRGDKPSERDIDFVAFSSPSVRPTSTTASGQTRPHGSLPRGATMAGLTDPNSPARPKTIPRPASDAMLESFRTGTSQVPEMSDRVRAATDTFNRAMASDVDPATSSDAVAPNHHTRPSVTDAIARLEAATAATDTNPKTHAIPRSESAVGRDALPARATPALEALMMPQTSQDKPKAFGHGERKEEIVHPSSEKTSDTSRPLSMTPVGTAEAIVDGKPVALTILADPEGTTPPPANFPPSPSTPTTKPLTAPVVADAGGTPVSVGAGITLNFDDEDNVPENGDTVATSIKSGLVEGFADEAVEPDPARGASSDPAEEDSSSIAVIASEELEDKLPTANDKNSSPASPQEDGKNRKPGTPAEQETGEAGANLSPMRRTFVRSSQLFSRARRRRAPDGKDSPAASPAGNAAVGATTEHGDDAVHHESPGTRSATKEEPRSASQQPAPHADPGAESPIEADPHAPAAVANSLETPSVPHEASHDDGRIIRGPSNPYVASFPAGPSDGKTSDTPVAAAKVASEDEGRDAPPDADTKKGRKTAGGSKGHPLRAVSVAFTGVRLGKLRKQQAAEAERAGTAVGKDSDEVQVAKIVDGIDESPSDSANPGTASMDSARHDQEVQEEDVDRPRAFVETVYPQQRFADRQRISTVAVPLKSPLAWLDVPEDGEDEELKANRPTSVTFAPQAETVVYDESSPIERVMPSDVGLYDKHEPDASSRADSYEPEHLSESEGHQQSEPASGGTNQNDDSSVEFYDAQEEVSRTANDGARVDDTENAASAAARAARAESPRMVDTSTGSTRDEGAGNSDALNTGDLPAPAKETGSDGNGVDTANAARAAATVSHTEARAQGSVQDVSEATPDRVAKMETSAAMHPQATSHGDDNREGEMELHAEHTTGMRDPKAAAEPHAEPALSVAEVSDGRAATGGADGDHARAASDMAEGDTSADPGATHVGTTKAVGAGGSVDVNADDAKTAAIVAAPKDRAVMDTTLSDEQGAQSENASVGATSPTNVPAPERERPAEVDDERAPADGLALTSEQPEAGATSQGPAKATTPSQSSTKDAGDNKKDTNKAVQTVVIQRVIRRIKVDGSEEIVTKRVRVRPVQVFANGDVIVERSERRLKSDGSGDFVSVKVKKLIKRRASTPSGEAEVTEAMDDDSAESTVKRQGPSALTSVVTSVQTRGDGGRDESPARKATTLTPTAPDAQSTPPKSPVRSMSFGEYQPIVHASDAPVHVPVPEHSAVGTTEVAHDGTGASPTRQLVASKATYANVAARERLVIPSSAGASSPVSKDDRAPLVDTGSPNDDRERPGASADSAPAPSTPTRRKIPRTLTFGNLRSTGTGRKGDSPQMAKRTKSSHGGVAIKPSAFPDRGDNTTEGAGKNDLPRSQSLIDVRPDAESVARGADTDGASSQGRRKFSGFVVRARRLMARPAADGAA